MHYHYYSELFNCCLSLLCLFRLNLQADCDETDGYKKFHLDLCIKAALYWRDCRASNVLTLVHLLNTLDDSEFLLELCSRAMDYEFETSTNLLSAFQPVYDSGPTVWFLDLSKRKASLLLKVLKLQTQKRPVVLSGLSAEETEVKDFLQCLPYITQLR